MIITKLGHYPTVLGIPWLQLHDLAVCFASTIVIFGLQYCITHRHDVPVTVQGVAEESPEPVNQTEDIFEPQIRPPRVFQGNIEMLNGASFFHTVKKGKLMVFEASQYDLNKAIGKRDLKKCPLEEVIPEQYHEFLPLFDKVLGDWLPPRIPGINLEVRLNDGETPTWGSLYSMSRSKLVILKEWFEDNTSKGFIRQS